MRRLATPRTIGARMDRLAERVEALEEEVRELRGALHPPDKLRRVVERMRKKNKSLPLRQLTKTLDRAVREVRGGRGRV